MSDATSIHSGINSIPLEVRQMIWTLLLVLNEPVHVCYSTEISPFLNRQGKPQGKTVSSPISTPSLLRVSKNFYEEAEPVLYSLNTFQFRGPEAIEDLILFLQSTSVRAYRGLIRHLILDLPYSTSKELQCPIDFLTGCNSLQSLTITCLPLRNKAIPKCLKTWMSSLRVEKIKFPDVPQENACEITQVIRGKVERTNSQAKKAHEARETKIARWGVFEFKKCDQIS